MNDKSVRLAVVDDEADIRCMIADYFSRDGYHVSRCASANELDMMLQVAPADLVILDVSLPGEDGISIARRLRSEQATPIIMLTGLHDVVDKVVGLEVGADDYVTKPFDLRELKARVRAVLRRSEAGAAGFTRQQANCERARLVSFGRVCLDLDRHLLIDEGGSEVHLTATEYNLLAAFARSPNRVLSREQLLDTAPGRNGEPFDRSIDIRVTRIRKKIEAVPSKPQVIRTVRNAGYIYVPPKVAA